MFCDAMLKLLLAETLPYAILQELIALRYLRHCPAAAPVVPIPFSSRRVHPEPSSLAGKREAPEAGVSGAENGPV